MDVARPFNRRVSNQFTFLFLLFRGVLFCFVLLPLMVFPQGLYLYLAENYREKVVYAILSGPEVFLGDFVELGGTP